MSNYPPGVTDADIDQHFGDRDEDEIHCVCEDRKAQLARGEHIVVWHWSHCPHSNPEYSPNEIEEEKEDQ